jgi:hypothetical protein
MAGEIIYSVFVSSTYEDLREERAAVQKALLQLHCMPIGMELFGSADEETWDFIKRQIGDCDYYVVIVADKYGSTADDGLSYTEKEYDYAREAKKPVLAFVHGDRGGIPRDKTEADPGKRSKLETFIQKVRRSPVSFFTSKDDLATQVTVSFVRLRERQPMIGFIRADQAPDLKRYSDLLEENLRLQAELAKIGSQAADVPFQHASEKMRVFADGQAGRRGVAHTLGQWFVAIAEKSALGLPYAEAIQRLVMNELPSDYMAQGWSVSTEENNKVVLPLVAWGLIEYYDAQRFKLTEYGRKQYSLLRGHFTGRRLSMR